MDEFATLLTVKSVLHCEQPICYQLQVSAQTAVYKFSLLLEHVSEVEHMWKFKREHSYQQ